MIIYVLIVAALTDNFVVGYPKHKDEVKSMDDFLEKLIHSDKLDSLAELIANKAVEKIKNLQNIDFGKFKESEKNKDKRSKSKPKLIYEVNVKNKKVTPDDVSLNYKKFTKGDPVEKNKRKEKSNSESYEVHHRVISDEKDLKNTETLSKNETKLSHINDQRSEASETESSNEKLHKPKTDNEKSVEISEKTIESIEKTTKVDRKYDDDSVNSIKSDEDSQESTKPLPNLMRKEGGQLYTFENSPDYREYHEQLLAQAQPDVKEK